MVKISSRTLFLTTSPRTPGKMIPEIDLLIKHFAGKPWTPETQRSFMEVLRNEQFFNGKGEKDPSFSARDRINRAPMSLGFVVLSPMIALTDAGYALIHSKRKEDVFLKQMLKFQIPSPYHRPTLRAAAFCIRPYLEMLRLVRVLGSLKFDELQIFGMQLTDWHDFDDIVKKINLFRVAKAEYTGSYKKFKWDYLRRELERIYEMRIGSGEIRTRESPDISLEKFFKTQSQNMRDYADACFRYLQATGLVTVSYIGKSLSIVPERKEDVDYILGTVSRDPVSIDDEKAYAEYLGSLDYPVLLTDNRDKLIHKIQTEYPEIRISDLLTLSQLKELYQELSEKRKDLVIRAQVNDIKNCQMYDDIQGFYDRISGGGLYDAPLMFEWNMWRAMTMLDGGNILANLHFDDFGHPMSSASGNVPDIVCDYGDFIVCVEVTLSSGQRQFEMEGEPVMRHLGKMKKSSGKPCYCLFVAPNINTACIVFFYTLYRTSLSLYGGKLAIVPLPLSVFRKMLEDSYRCDYVPNSDKVKKLFEASVELADVSSSEEEWYEALKDRALHWLD